MTVDAQSMPTIKHEEEDAKPHVPNGAHHHDADGIKVISAGHGDADEPPMRRGAVKKSPGTPRPSTPRPSTPRAAQTPSSPGHPSTSSPVTASPRSPTPDSVSFSPKPLDLGSNHAASPRQQSPSSSTTRHIHAATDDLTPVATSLPPPRRKKKATAATAPHPPQLIDDLPRADDEALASFVTLDENWYANRHIGRSKGHEWGLVCECNYRPGRDDLSRACTEEAGCINRLTQTECLSADCRCAEHCQNQRFQRRQYADVQIVKTDKKGFGLRAARSIPAESFVYEYIGEVVEPEDFQKRMRRYHDERIPHFYFMMLQKDEYLDATKKGGVARFINHSCNPNCYVAKWLVGKHMRMGIFAQRDILQGEELTFNYNVDRYGNDAQPCYCGEPNCVGQLGGKTQTDIGGMSNLYIEALGIVDEVERLQARGSRKQKSRILDEDFNPTLHPLEEDETSTVATAIRQAANNRSILMKLLQRIDMTNDVAVHKRFVRLHGFVLMAGVLTEWKEDRDVIISCMKILAQWPLIARNKVVDTGVEAIVDGFRASVDADISSLASELFDAWQQLSLEFRIARKEGAEEDAGGEDNAQDEAHMRSRRRRDDDDDDSYRIQARMDEALDAAQAPTAVSRALEQVVPRPLGKFNGVPTGPNGGTPHRFTGGFRANGPSSAGGWRGGLGMGGSVGVGVGVNARGPGATFPSGPSTPQTPEGDPRQQHLSFGGAGFSTTTPNRPSSTSTMSIEEIIRRANESQAAEAARAQVEAEQSQSQSHSRSRSRPSPSKSKADHRESSKPGASSSTKKRKSTTSSKSNNGGSEQQYEKKHKSHATTDEEKTRKRLSGLIGEIVVRTMSKKKSQDPLSDREAFKRHAREATEVLVNKEMKRLQVFVVPDKISTEKKAKIKVFVDEYVDKIVARHLSKRKRGVDGEAEIVEGRQMNE